MNFCRAEEIVDTALARLAADLAGPLDDEEVLIANHLTSLCTAFSSFTELLACDGYFPKLLCSIRNCGDVEERIRNMRLADLYDRAMSARGDDRRAVRLGHSGL